jgi:cytoskeletal protein CcmA (bactofilin family)
MFKKRGQNENDTVSVEGTLVHSEKKPVEEAGRPVMDKSKNTILKGNKLIGDITVSCDLELSGEIEGNITSEKNSNIVIKGVCRGSIETREGNVDIEGELKGGNITAGNNVRIAGKFEGGEVKAQGRITIDGEFNGKLEGNEIEIGADARGTGEIFYKDYISVAKGALIEGQVCNDSC